MRIYNLSETVGAGMESRYTVNGKRVSRATYDAIKDSATRLDCFTTRGKQMPGGRIRGTNYVCVYHG